ncbi:MAG: hypothetical protein HYZ20_01865 [Burkholderiales bacterium]|nr:hypothetical protein [Burkholderiales bacterium]
MNRILLRGLVLAMVALQAPAAIASEDEFAIDARFRAKLIKVKVRVAALERLQPTLDEELDSASCGSQNIGNIDTGGNPAATPREVFVFAPNAINIVSGRGCR